MFCAFLMRDFKQRLFVIYINVLVCQQSNNWHGSLLTYIAEIGRGFQSIGWTLWGVVHHYSVQKRLMLRYS